MMLPFGCNTSQPIPNILADTFFFCFPIITSPSPTEPGVSVDRRGTDRGRGQWKVLDASTLPSPPNLKDVNIPRVKECKQALITKYLMKYRSTTAHFFTYLIKYISTTAHIKAYLLSEATSSGSNDVHSI